MLSVTRLVLWLVVGVAVAGAGTRESRKVGTKAASTFVNCGCQCSSLTFRDKYGRVQGNCKRADKTGAQWCYVEGWGSPCSDLSRSKRFNKPWSYEACATPPRHQCNSFGGGFGGSGHPSDYCVRTEDCKGQIFDGVWVCRNNKCEVQALCLFGNCNSGGSGSGFGSSGGSTCGRNGCGSSGSGGGYGSSGSSGGFGSSGGTVCGRHGCGGSGSSGGFGNTGGSTCGRNGCGSSGSGGGYGSSGSSGGYGSSGSSGGYGSSGSSGGFGSSGGTTCGRNGCGGSGSGGGFGSTGGSTCGRNGCGGSSGSGSGGRYGSSVPQTQCRNKRCFGQLSQILGVNGRRGSRKGK